MKSSRPEEMRRLAGDANATATLDMLERTWLETGTCSSGAQDEVWHENVLVRLRNTSGTLIFVCSVAGKANQH